MPMKNTINIGSQMGNYEIKIFSNFSFLADEIAKIWSGERIVVITDKTVGDLYLEQLSDALYGIVHEICPIVLPPGEDSQGIETLQSVYRFLLDNNINRSDLIITLGGGVIGDLGGFAAATFLRGVSYVQIPTTLLSQIDSSIGGKVAINFHGIKNVVGAFYNPKLVYINTNVLNTLPDREYKCGLAEAMVHALIADKDLVYYIHQNMFNRSIIDDDIIRRFIYRNCEIKANIVMQDECDNGIRGILNFGHTFGHALETLFEFKYKHGECVSVGIVSIFKVALINDFISKDIYDEITKILEDIGLPVKFDNVNWEKVIDIIHFDKKHLSNKIKLILPVGMGKVATHIVSFDNFKEMVLTRFKEK